jgi:translation elongation factor EF-Tu-like GTPase
VIQTQNAKYFQLNPASVNQTVAASLIVDRMGYDYVTFLVQLGKSSVAPTALSIVEGDTATPATAIYDSLAGVSTFVGGTAGTAKIGFTIATGAVVSETTSGPYAVMNVDCRGRKRYLKCSVTPAETTVVSITAIATRAANWPDGTAATVGPFTVVDG